MNADPEVGTVRTLVDDRKPSALDSKGKASGSKDWVESDTDAQLMLFIPFQATLKIDTIQVQEGQRRLDITVTNCKPDHVDPTTNGGRGR